MMTDIKEEDLSTKADALFQTLESTSQIDDIKDQVVDAHSELSTSLQASLISLATVTERALKSNANAKSGEVLLESLANASREVAWRKPFGPPSVPLDSVAEPKCVLSVAVNLISEPDNLDEWVATQALKLIANCCADEAENRRYVVQRNGLTKIVALPSLHDLARFAVSALYNICIDFEDAPGSLEEEANESSTTNNAERQLALAVSYDNVAFIRVMLSLTKDLGKTMYPFLAEVIEMASRQAALDPSYLFHSEVTPASNRNPSSNDQLSSILSELLQHSGARLAATSADCCASICNTVTNVLKQDTARKAFLARDDLLVPFAGLPFSFDEFTGFDSDEDEESRKDSMENLNQSSRKGYLRLTYEITAMPEFQERYSLISPQILSCIKLLKGDAPYSAYLCVILANLTTSLSTAEYLVSEHGIHTAVCRLILPRHENLLPAVSLLIKLALPDSNKTTLAKSGVFNSLLALLKNEPPSEVQREIIVAARLLIKGHPDNAALIGPEAPSTPQDPKLLNMILWTSTHTEDTALKLEIGRLAIELCRVSFKPGNQDLDDKKATINPAFADAISFIALHAEGNARSEGWFGLAAMSVSAQGQERVINALKSNELRTEMMKIANEKTGPSFENVKLMLTKLRSSTCEIPKEVKADIDAAYARLHLAEERNTVV